MRQPLDLKLYPQRAWDESGVRCSSYRQRERCCNEKRELV